MPKESFIRKKAVDILKDNNWITWYPAKIRYKQSDIFGVIDLLAFKKRQKKYIQLTTLSHVSERRKKIKNFFKKSKVEMAIEIWIWNPVKKIFKIEKIGPTSTKKEGLDILSLTS